MLHSHALSSVSLADAKPDIKPDVKPADIKPDVKPLLRSHRASRSHKDGAFDKKEERRRSRMRNGAERSDV